MDSFSTLSIEPLWRPGKEFEPILSEAAFQTERHSWSFVVDGRSLFDLLRDHDVVGVLGWADSEHDVAVAARLLAVAAPDLPPNRVALYVCPECGELGCGAMTVAISRDGDTITWSDFRWEVDWEDPENPEASNQPLDVGSFRFAYEDYARVIETAEHKRPANIG